MSTDNIANKTNGAAHQYLNGSSISVGVAEDDIPARMEALGEINGQLQGLLRKDFSSHPLLKHKIKTSLEDRDRALAFTLKHAGWTFSDVRQAILVWPHGSKEKYEGDLRYFEKLFGVDTSATTGNDIGSDTPVDGDGFEPDLDMSVLDHGRRPPVELPLDVFGGWGDWIATTAKCAVCSPDYVAMPLLAAISVSIGNARWVSPWAGWEEPPVLWVGWCGKPGTNKSPGLKLVKRTLGVLERNMAREFEELHCEWVSKTNDAKLARETWEKECRAAHEEGREKPRFPKDAAPPPELIRPRIVTQDATPESICGLVKANSKGVLMLWDELEGWYGSIGRYTGGSAEQPMWLEAFNGESFKIDRKNNPRPVEIDRLTVWIGGGVQPEKLDQMLAGPDNGLFPRFLWSWPRPVGRERPTVLPKQPELLEALETLHALPMNDVGKGEREPIVLRFSEEAATLFESWWIKNEDEGKARAGKLASAWSKMPGHLLRLSLVLEHLWWTAPGTAKTGRDRVHPGEISKAAVQGAIRLMDEYFGPMAERVYGCTGPNIAVRSAAVLAQHILTTKAKSLNARDLRRKRVLGTQEAGPVKAALDELVDAGWLRDPVNDIGPKGGRPKSNYVVNPKVWRDTNPPILCAKTAKSAKTSFGPLSA